MSNDWSTPSGNRRRVVLLTARLLSVDEAESVGLVQRRADDAVQGAQALAAEVAALALLSVKGHKKTVSRVHDASTLSAEELHVLAELELAAFQSADRQEGPAAFSEKRQPNFGGS